MTNCITYTPNSNYNGPDMICVRVCDEFNACDEVDVPITVTPVNDSPIANDDVFTTNENVPVVNTVITNDSDVDGPQVIVSVVPGLEPTNGNLVLNTDGTFTYTPDPNFVGVDQFTYQYCDGGTPDLCDNAVVTITVNGVFVRLTAKVSLQGALLNSPTEGIMRDQLRTKSYFPVSTPYTTVARFKKVQNNAPETINPIILGDQGNNSIVDWVFVELRNSADMTQIVATRSGLLQRDGDIVDVDGVSPLLFSSTSAGNYFVTVRHRNHLGASTAQTFALSSAPNLVDFTSTSVPLFNRTASFDEVEMAVVGGIRALWLGNSTVDDRTVFSGQLTDKTDIFNVVDEAPANTLKSQSFVFDAYRTTDLDLSSQTIFAGQNNEVTPLFNVVDSHPRNLTFRLQSFNIVEQVPDTSNQ